MRLRRSDFHLDDVSPADAWGRLCATLRRVGFDAWRGRQGWYPDEERRATLLLAWMLRRARNARGAWALTARCPVHLLTAVRWYSDGEGAQTLPPRPIPLGTW
jgi:hypothetical protein